MSRRDRPLSVPMLLTFLLLASTGALGGIANVVSRAPAARSMPLSSFPTVTSASDPNRILIFTVWSPHYKYALDTQFCVWDAVDANYTITEIHATCDANPATEPTGDLKYADAFIGLANPTVLHAFDTTNGVFDSGAETLALPIGKCLYLQWDAEPDEDITQMNFWIKIEKDE